jgi:hypothetical protein
MRHSIEPMLEGESGWSSILIASNLSPPCLSLSNRSVLDFSYWYARSIVIGNAAERQFTLTWGLHFDNPIA